jgi:hypothetical protein
MRALEHGCTRIAPIVAPPPQRSGLASSTGGTGRDAGGFGAPQPSSTSPRNARQRRGMQYHSRCASPVSEPISATSPTTIAAMPKPVARSRFNSGSCSPPPKMLNRPSAQQAAGDAQRPLTAPAQQPFFLAFDPDQPVRPRAGRQEACARYRDFAGSAPHRSPVVAKRVSGNGFLAYVGVIVRAAPRIGRDIPVKRGRRAREWQRDCAGCGIAASRF